MNAAAGTNPQAATVTKVTFRSSQQATQARPVGLGYRKVSCKKELAGFVESLIGGKDASFCPSGTHHFKPIFLLRNQGAIGLNECRTNRDREEGHQNEYDERRDHLNGSLGSLFFGALAASGAQRIRVNA